MRLYIKPLIVGSLLLFYALSGLKWDKQEVLVIGALVFSLAGDVLLMYEQIDSIFFILGLVSFLIAHICYSIVFYDQADADKNSLWFSIILVALAILLFYYLKNGLGSLLIPVIIYMMVILTMVIMAYTRDVQVSRLSYALVLLGALFFMISDGALAIDKFNSSFKGASQFIIATYAIAQYLIVMGQVKKNDDIDLGIRQ